MQKKIIYIGNKLSKHGINMTSIETFGPLLEKGGCEVIYASEKKHKIPRLLDMLWTTLRYGRQVDYVLIDTYSTWNFWYAFFVALLCRVMRIKYIAKLHGGNLPSRIQRWPWCSRQIFDYSFANVAPSNYLYEAFMKEGYTNLYHIPNTIKLKNYVFTQRSQVRPRLLWVRKIAPIYHPMMALEVLELVREKYPEVHLTMVGPQMPDLYQQMKARVHEKKLNVTFTGGLKKSEWRELSRHFDIFINTTHYDNMPVSVMEAMALGLPIVSTNVGGLPYLIDHMHDGILVHDSDAKAMADAIDQLIVEPGLAERLTQNALAKVATMDNKVVVEQWRKLLQ